MEWVHQHHVDETVGRFVLAAVPDAQPGWEDVPWRIEEMGRTEGLGRWWTVAVDIPTSADGLDCWLTFRVVEPGSGVGGSHVERVRAVRSGLGGRECDTCVWVDAWRTWVTATEGE